MGARCLPLVLIAGACAGKSAPAPPGVTPTGAPPTPGISAPPLAAGAPTPAAGSPQASRTPGHQVTLAEVGLEAASLDRSADPCVDFYQFACGGWLRANPIPPDRARWGRFGELDEKIKVAVQGLLEDMAKGAGTDATANKLGDYYASCMDEAAIEQAGLAGIKPLLAKTSQVKDARTWLVALTALHDVGIWVVWNADAYADLKDSTRNVTYLDSAGLGLPDRDYYVNADFAPKVEAYRQHVARMLTLGGVTSAEAAAADVLAIETALARVTKTAVEKRDPDAAYNVSDLKGMTRYTRSVDWRAYFKAVGFAPSVRLVVGTPKYFQAVDGLRRTFKPGQWASYFTYHLLARAAFWLPKAFDDEALELAKVLTGVTKKQARDKRCTDVTTKALGDLLGRAYVEKYVPPSARNTATELFDALVRVMREEIGRLTWMSEPTKVAAQDKLANLVRMIGHPDNWRSYDFEVRRDDFAGNELRAARYETRRVLARSGTPVARGEWYMNAFTVDAYYNALANNTALPAGILQPPFFGADRGIAANLGGIGMLIGHELTHGFDDQGAKFDAAGNLVNWWTADDKAKFAERGRCVRAMYDTFEAAPKAFVNGELTLGENIADLGGVKLAFRAYRALRQGASQAVVADGFDEDQQFFLAVGQVWCAKDRLAEVQHRLTVDPHAPPKFRVYGALRNLPEFARAFRCAPGTPMNPMKSCSVW
jgi:putative endopeptidase